ncbi:MAG: hypothetical protein RLY16_2631 [Bacteroidota bacterium]|jgi:hypothetical protein
MKFQLHPPLQHNCKVLVYDSNGKQMLSSVVNTNYLNELSDSWWRKYLPKGDYKAFIFDADQNKRSLQISID